MTAVWRPQKGKRDITILGHAGRPAQPSDLSDASFGPCISSETICDATGAPVCAVATYGGGHSKTLFWVRRTGYEGWGLINKECDVSFEATAGARAILAERLAEIGFIEFAARACAIQRPKLVVENEPKPAPSPAPAPVAAPAPSTAPASPGPPLVVERLEWKLISDSWWEARPYLQQIRSYAHSRGVGADAAFGVIAARFGAFMDHRIRLETGVKEKNGIPPTLFVAIVAHPGVGKSSAYSVMAPIIPGNGPLHRDKRGIGSGEGLIEIFMGEKVVGQNAKGKDIIERCQMYHNACLFIDEGGILKKLTSGDGATIIQRLNTAWVSGPLETPNASRETKRNVENYNLSIVGAFTPTAACSLLNGEDEGHPHRWLFLTAYDRNMPLLRPNAVEPPAFNLNVPGGYMRLCESLQFRTWAEVTGPIRMDGPEPGSIDAHRLSMTYRLAMFFAAMDGRNEVCNGDVELAEEPMEVSAGNRGVIIGLAARAAEEAEAENNRRFATRAVITKQAAASGPKQIRDLAIRVTKRVHKKGKSANSDLKNNVFDREDRGLFEAVVRYAESYDWIAREGNVHWVPGGAVPSEMKA